MQPEIGAPAASDDHKKFDSPDLWVRIRAAKEQLYTETNFLIKYRASSPRQAIGLTGADCTGAETSNEESEGREPEKSSSEWDVSVVASVKLPTVTPARWTAAAQSNHHNHTPSQQEPSGQNQADQKPDPPPVPDSPKARVKVAHPSVALYIAPHLRDPALQSLRPPQRYRTSRPFRPIPVRSEYKQHQASSAFQSTFFKSHLVTPPPNPSRLREEVRHPAVQSQSHPPSLSPEVNQDTTLDKEMSDTGSDEIMLTRGNKFRGRQQEQQENMQARKASAGPSGAADKAKQERKDELQRLREEIVREAHLNRFKHLDCDDANPEALAICRKGPGTDQNSDFYQLMASRRRAGRITTVVEKPKPSSSSELSSDAEEGKEVKLEFDAIFKDNAAYEKHAAQWEAYALSPHIYPIVKDRKTHLSRTPTAEHKLIEKEISQTGLNPASIQTDKNMPLPVNKWADVFYVDWEYRPRAYSGLEGFRDWFRRWFDTTSQICRYADVYHEAFFDGTAHPDGVRIMFTPNLDDDDVFLDTNDEMTMLHAHETAEGYCHNWVLHSRKQQEEVQLRKEMNRQAYLEAMRTPPRENPNSPKANIFLRPAQLDDSHGILRIMNWYARSSTLSTDIHPLETGDVRQRIENCQENKLPFIVAVERQTGPTREKLPEKILGYALAKDTVGLNTSGRYTAELHVFVKNGHTLQGIGRCLLDKLLEVCDPTYIPKFGYFFNAAFDDQPRFHSGGCRRLARLIFAVGYHPDRKAEVQWLKKWLLDKYEFEEQAVLKGMRVKFDHFNDVSYLVRTVGRSPNTKFEY